MTLAQLNVFTSVIALDQYFSVQPWLRLAGRHGKTDMGIIWHALRDDFTERPYSGQQVLVAVPHWIGEAFGGGGRLLDPDYPYSAYLAHWDRNELKWATTETDEETYGTFWLSSDAPCFWADLIFPLGSPIQ